MFFPWANFFTGTNFVPQIKRQKVLNAIWIKLCRNVIKMGEHRLEGLTMFRASAAVASQSICSAFCNFATGALTTIVAGTHLQQHVDKKEIAKMNHLAFFAAFVA